MRWSVRSSVSNVTEQGSQRYNPSHRSSTSVAIDDGHQLLNERTARMWPRRDNLPIFPLTSGWCVVLSDEGEAEHSRYGTASEVKIDTHFVKALDGWQRDEFVVQVLVPQPACRLVLIGAPFRIFNYTDRELLLKFT
mmetsp:Transcript_51370/g.96316  ORF Transcript_51370/g.96316 Transcript_51370/m.96316 type:complete len:137 (+) Transcript_51370:293-703(+)